MDSLEGEKQAKLKQFQEITNIEDADVAFCTLESLDWNLERAIETHLLNDGDDASQNVRPEEGVPAPVVPPRRPLRDISDRYDVDMDVSDSSFVLSPEDNDVAELQAHRRAPRASPSNGHRDHPLPESSSSNANYAVVDSEDEVIFDDEYSAAHDDTAITVKQRGSSQVPLIPTEVNSVMDALHNLVSVFEARFATAQGSAAPNFSVDTLNNTIREAFEAPGRDISERRPLALYIHNDRSVAANIFASNIMCRDEISNLLRHQFVLWGWDITFRDNEQKLAEWISNLGMFDTRHIVEMMRYDSERFPLLLLLTREKGNLKLVDICYGTDSADQVMSKLLTCVEEYQSIRLNEANEKREREERERIRQEQHMEYEMSLAADRARKEAKDREIREQQEEEERRRLAVEEEKMRRAKLESELPSEPAENAPDAIMVKFRVPEGGQFVRRFRNSEHLSVLMKFLGSKGFSKENFRFFNSDFPKKDISIWDADSTFEALKWPRREQIFVEEQ